MKDKNRILYRISLLTGAIPLIGGWAIFLIWLSARYSFASDLENLEIAGFFWLMICFFISCIGLLVLAAYAAINRKQLHIRMLVALIVILINIPSVLIILPWQGRIDSKVFINLKNQSNVNFEQLTLSGNTVHPIEICTLEINESVVFHYKPTYKPMGERMYPVPDSLTLTMATENGRQEISNFPTFYRGQCEYLVITTALEIESP